MRIRPAPDLHHWKNSYYFSELDVVAIDIGPATETVHQADFLNLKVDKSR